MGRLARESVARGDFMEGFEDVYIRAGDPGEVPWGDLAPNPNLVSWLAKHEVSGDGRRALTVGSDFGDDAEALAERAFSVTAFDIAPTAIASGACGWSSRGRSGRRPKPARRP